MPGNGHDPGRLDRLEGLVEVLFNRHLEFEDEHKRLLMAQVVLTDRIDRLAQRMDEMREFQKHSDERLDALIAAVDEIRRNRPPQAP